VSPDGRLLAYSANQRVDTDLDILVRDLVSGEVRALLAADNRHFPLSWSPDSRHVLILRLNQNTDHDLLLCAAATGECRRLTTRRPGDEARYLPGSWEPDGSGFYLATDEGRDTAGLAFFDLRQDRLRWLPSTDADSEAEVESVTLSGDGRYLAWASSRDGA
jgi:Tol biopolymer transport system component